MRKETCISGRNLDWSFSYGETILVTPRAYKYDYVFGAEAKAEPNAVIGIGVVMADKPMYFDCANENGLAIAGLNFPGYASFAHEPIDGTINVAPSNSRCGWPVTSIPWMRSRKP